MRRPTSPSLRPEENSFETLGWVRSRPHEYRPNRHGLLGPQELDDETDRQSQCPPVATGLPAPKGRGVMRRRDATMNLLLLLSHPDPSSFNHALAQTIGDAARSEGCAVTLHDLYAEGFDPVMPVSELAKDAPLPPDIERHCREVETADRIAIVHPNWWSAPPAMLRGWCDRCLRTGRAYNFVPDEQGGAKPVGLLKARAALVINTANTPQAVEESAFGDPLQTHWLKVVFGLCGISTVLRRNFAPVITSTPEQRASWLQETRQLTRQLVAA